MLSQAFAPFVWFSLFPVIIMAEAHSLRRTCIVFAVLRRCSYADSGQNAYQLSKDLSARNIYNWNLKFVFRLLFFPNVDVKLLLFPHRFLHFHFFQLEKTKKNYTFGFAKVHLALCDDPFISDAITFSRANYSAQEMVLIMLNLTVHTRHMYVKPCIWSAALYCCPLLAPMPLHLHFL